jgi:hypothetical protein
LMSSFPWPDAVGPPHDVQMMPDRTAPPSPHARVMLVGRERGWSPTQSTTVTLAEVVVVVDVVAGAVDDTVWGTVVEVDVVVTVGADVAGAAVVVGAAEWRDEPHPARTNPPTATNTRSRHVTGPTLGLTTHAGGELNLAPA